MIYFDNNSTTPIDKEILEKMMPYFETQYGNPSSPYNLGKSTKIAIESARKNMIDKLLNGKGQIIFTGSGSESDNMAIKTIPKILSYKDVIITSEIEHHAILNSAMSMAKEGFMVKYVKTLSTGEIDLADMERLLLKYKHNISLVSIMGANNETGTIQPIVKISEIIEKIDPTIIFHVDAVQSFSWEGVPAGCDLFTISGHKLNAPKGIGALCLRQSFFDKLECPFLPLIDGGKQENGYRAGTENVPYIIALNEACNKIICGDKNKALHCLEIKTYIQKFLMENVKNIKINGENTLPNTLNVSFDGIDGASLVEYLNEFDICIATGSACNTGSPKPSHVLKALGLSDEQAMSSIRISVGLQNTLEEANYFCEKVLDGVSHLRKISGYYNFERS